MMLDELALFVRVLESGSLSAAARLQGVPKSTVSRALARLEAHLGTRLLQRTSRRLALTEAGRLLYEQSAPHVAALKQATRTLGALEEEPQGVLRVTAPHSLGLTFLADIAARFTQRYPRVHVEVSLSGQLVDLVAEGYDVAIRAGQLSDSSLQARKITEGETRLFAAPTYLARRGTPQTPRELEAHECVLFRSRGGRTRWELTSAQQNVAVEVGGRVAGDDFLFVHAVVRAGAGIGAMPSFLARQELAAGTLVSVLPEWRMGNSGLYVVHASARHAPRKVVAFRDFVLESFHSLTPR